MFESTFNRVTGSVIASGIASIVLGILFLMAPVLSALTMCFFIGIMIVIAGVAKMIFCFVQARDIAASFIGGLLMFLIGLLCLFRPDIIASFLTIMAGIYVVANGVLSLSEGITCARAKISGGVLIVVMSILLIICGFYIMFAPFSYIMIMAGIVLIVDGIFNFIFVAVLKDKVEQAKEELML